MKFYEIVGETKETRRFTPCTFAVIGNSILSASPEFGEFPRDDWDLKKLQAHLQRMRDEGFTVRELHLTR